MAYNVNTHLDGSLDASSDAADPGERGAGTIPRLADLPFRALGGQPAFDSTDLDDMVREPRIALLAYTRRDGRPNQAPIWYAYRDGVVVITIATGSAKHHALQRDPRVSLVIHDERPPYRAVIIDGTAQLSELSADDSLSYDTAVRYFGKIGADEYWKLSAEERDRSGTTLITIVPDEVKGFDNTRAISRLLVAFSRLRNRLPIPRRWL